MSITHYPMPPLRPDVERDSYGRYVLPNPDEPGNVKSYTRATTMAGAIADKYNVSQWQRRMVLLGVANEPSILDFIDPDADPSERDVKELLGDLADKAHAAAGGNDAADRGTTLHYFTEAVDGGHMTVDEVPGEYRREVQAYVATMAGAGITVVPDMVERILLNTTVNVAGTADRQHVIMPNGARLVADVKTGKELSWNWAEIAMQLAIYAHADAMLAHDADGNPYWDGVPEVDQRYALVMHVPVDKGTCALYLVDLTAGWAAVELALEVRAYRSRRNLALPLDVKAWLPEGKTLDDVKLPLWGQAPTKAISDGDGNVVAHTTGTSEVFTAPITEGDPFAPAPSESVTDASPEAAAIELTPLDEARRAFDKTVAEAAEARAARSRRNTQQKRADEAATLVDDGTPTVDLYQRLTRDLRAAYKLDVEPKTAPAPAKADEPAVVPTAEPAPDVTAVQTKFGTPVTVPSGEPTEAAVRRVECTEAIDRAEPTQAAFSALYEEYSDVWENFHTERAGARINAADEANATPEVVSSSQLDPRLTAALDACSTAEDMGTVYSQWIEVYGPDSWLDSFTEYGKAALAAKS